MISTHVCSAKTTITNPLPGNGASSIPMYKFIVVLLDCALCPRPCSPCFNIINQGSVYFVIKIKDIQAHFVCYFVCVLDMTVISLVVTHPGHMFGVATHPGHMFGVATNPGHMFVVATHATCLGVLGQFGGDPSRSHVWGISSVVATHPGHIFGGTTTVWWRAIPATCLRY